MPFARSGSHLSKAPEQEGSSSGDQVSGTVRQTEERPSQQAPSIQSQVNAKVAQRHPQPALLPGPPEPGRGYSIPLPAANREFPEPGRKPGLVVHDSLSFSLVFRIVLFKRSQFIFYSKSIRNNCTIKLSASLSLSVGKHDYLWNEASLPLPLPPSSFLLFLLNVFLEHLLCTQTKYGFSLQM